VEVPQAHPARELLHHLYKRDVLFAIATSGARATTSSALALLERPGAYRVYADNADMFAHIEEVGVRPIR
jgi:hypothetical protein